MNKWILLLLLLTSCSHPLKTNPPHSEGSSPKDIYVSQIPTRGLDFSAALTKVAFGSCANQDQPEPLWKDIAAARPDLFLFLGDNVYASSPSQQPIAEQYKKLDAIPEYLELRKSVPFMATWDDHDYGQRDGGADWSGKENARRDFLNYWSYARNSLPLEQGGVYHAKILGPKKKTVQIIMLDTRYYRSPLIESPGNEGKAMNYVAQETGTILGENQWQWLEEQLKRPADLRFIVTSIQLIANDPPYEKWGNFPKERQRFFDLLKKTRTKNAILLSGDRHIASVSKIDLEDYGPLYEITSSSINRANNFNDADRHYIGNTYNKENFGLAQIDWKRKKVLIEVRGFSGEVANKVEINFKK